MASLSQTVPFTLDKSDFGFYDNNGELVVEPGTINVYAGKQLEREDGQSFDVTG